MNGKPSKFIHNGVLGILGAMGMLSREQWQWDFNRKWGEVAAYGAVNAKDRVKRLDAENLAAAIIYPTIGLGWECECEDAEVAQAMTRAYNRWIVDWCSDSGGRLIPVAHLSLLDPEASAIEMERAVKDGCKGAWVGSFAMTASRMGIPTTTRCSPRRRNSTFRSASIPRFRRCGPIRVFIAAITWAASCSSNNVIGTDAARQAMTSFIQYGTFDKFPRLKIVMLESGAGWVSYLLDRWDDVWKSHFGHTLTIKDKPSNYFRRNIFISADPDEHSLPAMIELCGEDRFFWASDFPASRSYRRLSRRTGGDRPQSSHRQRSRKLLGENVKQAYHLDV